MKTKITLMIAYFVFGFCLVQISSHASKVVAAPHISVGKARIKKSILALPNVKTLNSSSRSIANRIHKTLNDDLAFMDLFKILPKAAYIENPQTAGMTPDKFKFSDWTSLGTEYLVKTQITTVGKKLKFEGYVYDVTRGRQIVAKRYVANLSDDITVAHTFGNDLIKAMTGLPGIFLTKIAMICDRGRKQRSNVYIMDFNGKNLKQITFHRSISLSPAWSPDGTRLAYSLYVSKNRVKNMNLYEFDFRTNRIRLLSNRKGINSGAAYSPDGKAIAMTMSFLGNPEIFELNLKSKRVTRLTKSRGFDVDPTWSPNGKQIAFISNRRGKPMVFSVNRNGTNIQRLTMAGRYNSAPNWSPTNNKIAFAGWLSNKFDLFTMNPDGTTIERLTKNVGSNEDPVFSPDGQFIAFSSNRTGKRNIYVMNMDGSFVRRLTFGLGNCSAPKWSNPPK